MANRPVIYLAGPYRAATSWGIAQNVHAAREAMASATREGLFVICPHTMTDCFQSHMPDAFWLDMTLELMRRCDAVWVFSLEPSAGVWIECAEADARGIPVFNDFGALLTWVDERGIHG